MLREMEQLRDLLSRIDKLSEEAKDSERILAHHGPVTLFGKVGRCFDGFEIQYRIEHPRGTTSPIHGSFKDAMKIFNESVEIAQSRSE